MIDINTINPIIGDPGSFEAIQFFQSRETLMDAEEYSKFIYAVENAFRRSRFYKDYKSYIMSIGLDFDQEMKAINSEIADIELHHLMPTLKDAAIMITEHNLNMRNRVCTFDVIKELENAHRNNMMSVVMLTKTMHQQYHHDPNAFISLSQAYGNCFDFLNMYRDGLTLDISFKWLLQLKSEDQYDNKTNWLQIPRQREILLDWSSTANINY